MIYPYMTLADETESVHSQVIKKDGQKKEIVNFERPKEKGVILQDVNYPIINGRSKRDI